MFFFKLLNDSWQWHHWVEKKSVSCTVIILLGASFCVVKDLYSIPRLEALAMFSYWLMMNDRLISKGRNCLPENTWNKLVIGCNKGFSATISLFHIDSSASWLHKKTKKKTFYDKYFFKNHWQIFGCFLPLKEHNNILSNKSLGSKRACNWPCVAHAVDVIREGTVEFFHNKKKRKNQLISFGISIQSLCSVETESSESLHSSTNSIKLWHGFFHILPVKKIIWICSLP